MKKKGTKLCVERKKLGRLGSKADIGGRAKKPSL